MKCAHAAGLEVRGRDVRSAGEVEGEQRRPSDEEEDDDDGQTGLKPQD